MAEGYQSLYRRYRSRRFSELRGQDHVTRALRNAVREGRVGHAYLFSGPRGTGKTSTARILAKVLNCDAPVDGEPCGACDNCRTVDEGRMVDWLQEHDAASNNRVEPMRDLLEKVPLGTSGKRKVIILDEVHMLTGGAANALLKTLEEPPEHVVFVLATTDPQKVLPTIRSRTQHFEFHLLPAEELADHVRWVIQDAGLELGEDAVDHVVRIGGGSARDTLSALDQVSALGGVVDEEEPVDAVLAALVERDAGGILVAVAEAVAAGRDIRVLGTNLVERLRNAFLAMMGAPERHLPPGELERSQHLGEALGAAGVTRALEVIGEALVELAKKPDPRIVLEVALVRLTRPDVDRTLDAVLERLDRLERSVSGGLPISPAAPADSGPGPASQARAELARRGGQRPGPVAGVVKKAAPRPAAAQQAPPTESPSAPTAPVDAADAPVPAPDAPAGPPAAAPAAPAAGPGAGASELPSREELTLAWGDHLLGELPGGARALFRMGRFVESADGRRARFALPNAPHRDQCEKKRAEVEAALARHFGRPVPLQLVTDAEVGDGGGAADAPSTAPSSPGPAPEEEIPDVHDLEDAPGVESGVERLTQAFPGAELIEE